METSGGAVENRAYRAGVVFLVSLAALVPLYFLLHDELAGQQGDALIYREMARRPFTVTAAPFCFRFLSPLIVWLLPFGEARGFIILTFASLAATAAVFYLYLREFYTHQRALVGIGLFLFSPCVTWNLQNPYLVDPLSYLFIALAFLLLRREKWAALALALAVGVCAKEIALFVLVVVAAVAVFKYKLRPLARWAMIFILPCLAYVVPRYAALIWGVAPQSYNYLSKQNLHIVWRYRDDILKILISTFIYSFGVCWLLLPWGLGRAVRFVRLSAALLIPVMLSVALVTDWTRMLAYAFPVVIAAVCAIRWRPIPAAVFVALYAATTVGTFPLPPSYFKYVMTFALLVAGAAIAAREYRDGRAKSVGEVSTA